MIRGRPEGSCSLRNSGALARRSNSAVRATGVDSRRFLREIIVWNMLQLTSRRFLRELDEAPGRNNLQYILKFPCIPFFGN